jgi:hypothetical protein
MGRQLTTHIQNIAAVSVLLLSIGCLGPPAQPQSAGARRLALLNADTSTQQLTRAMQDDDVIIRRTATRLLGRRGATEALLLSLQDEDLLVRRTGLAALIGVGGEAALDAVAQALGDSSSVVRLLAVEHLAASRPHSPWALELLDVACQDADDKVRQIATRATWPFYRNAPSVRDGGTDLDITAAETIRLPKTDWRFQLDPRREGHRLGWFRPDFEDGEWAMIATEQVWQEAGYQYTGVAWYRRSFDLPEEPANYSVDISFGGVDESTWFWINGLYAGDHDIGPSGWNVPFRRDVSSLLRWGETNQITVRAMNTAHGGGIWKPIEIEVLQR